MHTDYRYTWNVFYHEIISFLIVYYTYINLWRQEHVNMSKYILLQIILLSINDFKIRDVNLLNVTYLFLHT